jgi:hypothetical protein
LVGKIVDQNEDTNGDEDQVKKSLPEVTSHRDNFGNIIFIDGHENQTHVVEQTIGRGANGIEVIGHRRITSRGQRGSEDKEHKNDNRDTSHHKGEDVRPAKAGYANFKRKGMG